MLMLARESLAKAETSSKHLEERAEYLTRQIQVNEEKLAIYERRGSTTGAIHTSSDGLSREQQLEAEIAEIRYAY
jgi:nucleoprotein TPR